MAQNVEHMVDTTFGSAEKVKLQAADAMEEAVRKLRDASMTAKGDEVKAIIHDTEAKLSHLKSQVGEKVEPVEEFITDHPLMSIALAAGAGLLIGALLTRRD